MNLTVEASNRGTDTEIKLRFADRSVTMRITGERVTPGNYDFAVWTILLYAMLHRHNISIELPITEELPHHIEILQSYLSRYLGLARVQLAAPNRAAEVTTRPRRTLVPFSGGVDSCFTVLYNVFELGNRIDAALIANGLDLNDQLEYQLARERCDKILALSGARTLSLETDYRKRLRTLPAWSLHSDFVLAGLLHLFDKSFGRAFISGEGDGGLVGIAQSFKYPFLSERLFFLFSNSSMLVEAFDGAYHTKFQKICYISKFPEVRQNLRVCWKNKKHSNCGKCRKCIMTQLAFLAACGEIPACFPNRMGVESVQYIVNQVKRNHQLRPEYHDPVPAKAFRDFLEVAKRNGIRHPYLDQVQAALPQISN